MNTNTQTNLGTKLQTNIWYKIAEILVVFLLTFALILAVIPFVEGNLILTQLVVWVANIFMLALVWLGLRLRGESLEDFGVTFKVPTWKEGLRIFLLSLLVFVLAMLGFILGSIIMANIVGIPEGANMSNYAYLKDNIGMLFLTLIGVYIVSSFGEEVVYRGFLINRIEQIGISSRYATTIAIIISAIIFGFAHYSWGPMGIVQTAFMGLALAICYIKLKRRLWILIIAHMYMDTILMVQVYLNSN